MQNVSQQQPRMESEGHLGRLAVRLKAKLSASGRPPKWRKGTRSWTESQVFVSLSLSLCRCVQRVLPQQGKRKGAHRISAPKTYQFLVARNCFFRTYDLAAGYKWLHRVFASKELYIPAVPIEPGHSRPRPRPQPSMKRRTKRHSRRDILR